jgi:oligopeptidase A
VKEAFQRETIELQEYRADAAHQTADLFQPWEVSFWSEKAAQVEVRFRRGGTAPFFPLDKVLSGMFQLAEKVFDLRIVSREVVYVEPGKDAPDNISTQPGEGRPGRSLAP